MKPSSDPLGFRVNECVRRSEVDPHIEREPAREIVNEGKDGHVVSSLA